MRLLATLNFILQQKTAARTLPLYDILKLRQDHSHLSKSKIEL